MAYFLDISPQWRLQPQIFLHLILFWWRLSTWLDILSLIWDVGPLLPATHLLLINVGIWNQSQAFLFDLNKLKNIQYHYSYRHSHKHDLLSVWDKVLAVALLQSVFCILHLIVGVRGQFAMVMGKKERSKFLTLQFVVRSVSPSPFNSLLLRLTLLLCLKNPRSFLLSLMGTFLLFQYASHAGAHRVKTLLISEFKGQSSTSCYI